MKVLGQNHISQQRVSEYLWEYRYFFSILCIGLVYFFNLFIDIMDIDAAQYASISREMMESGSYLQVFEQGKDYLDKPPLLFWISSLSLKIFGVHNFAYKLPAVLIIILGLYSTFRFTLLWYNKRTAWYSVIILGTTQAFYLITNDIRTDGILTSFIIFAVWQLFRFLKDRKISGLILGAVGASCALMAKGPIGLVIIAFAVGGDLLIKLQLKKILDYRWLVFIFIIAVLLFPMCYGLYTQFDLHPEKTAYGISNPSGLKFFFWTQSFGRITGESSWKNDTSFFTFFHTILWDFQPWVFLMLAMIFYKIKNLVGSFKLHEKYKKVEYASLFGFILPFLALSLSSYKLPHYIFPTFPFMAIMVADFINALSDKKWAKRLAQIQFGISHSFFLVPFVAFGFFFSLQNNFILPTLLVLLYLLFWRSFEKIKDVADKIIFSTLIAIWGFGLVTSTYFYPNLLQFQASSIAAKEIVKEPNLPPQKLYAFNAYESSLSFYAQQIISEFKIDQTHSYPAGIFVFSDEEGKDKLLKYSEYELIKSYVDYNITALSLPFLLKKTRNDHLENRFLLKKIR